MWGYGPYYGSYGGGWGVAMMVFGGIFWLAVLAFIIAAVVWFMRSPGRGGQGPSPIERGPTALDILEERYARGEIDRDEYLQKKRDLSGGDVTGGGSAGGDSAGGSTGG